MRSTFQKDAKGANSTHYDSPSFVSRKIRCLQQRECHKKIKWRRFPQISSGGGGGLPIVDYMERLRPKRGPFSDKQKILIR